MDDAMCLVLGITTRMYITPLKIVQAMLYNSRMDFSQRLINIDS